jgi:DNA ligase-1
MVIKQKERGKSMIRPMLLQSANEPFDSDEYIYEPKYDGIRLLIENTSSPMAYSRHLNDVTTKFPELLPIPYGVLLDGEVVQPDIKRLDNFEDLMSRFALSKTESVHTASLVKPVTLIAFDILKYEGKTLYSTPLMERKAILDKVIKDINNPQIIKTMYGENAGHSLFEVIKEHSLEGIVAKKKRSLYRPATRSYDWLKIINWTRTEGYIAKVKFNPLTLIIENEMNAYLGAIELGITKIHREAIIAHFNLYPTKRIPCIVKSRGLTSKGKLRLAILDQIFL